MKKKIEKFKNLDELKFTLPPVLYDVEAEQTVPLTIHQFTPAGFKSGYAAHVLKPLSDSRFFQQEAEFEKLKNKDFAPVRKLWKELIKTRIGYKKNDDFSHVTDDDIKRIFNVARTFEIEIEEVEGEEEFDDSGETVLNFRVFYGGEGIESWKSWLGGGELPENIKLDEDSYDAVLELLKKGIAPAAYLPVSFSIPQTKYSDNVRFFDIQESGQMAKLTTAAKDKRTKAEQLAEFYDDLGIAAEGYKNDPPALHKSYVVQNYFAIKTTLLGKS